MQYVFVGMIIIAWILSWFSFDDLFIKGFYELTSKTISTAGYYFLFLVVGVVIDLIIVLRGK